MNRFIKINDNLFRGSAPSVNEVKQLKSKYKINKIISLDQTSADKISNICKLLKIKQIIIPINDNLTSLLKLKDYDIKELLEEDSPTFVHCYAGKDRTGFLIALYKVLNGESAKIALDEAKKIGFGKNCEGKFLFVIKAMENIIKTNEKDNNNNLDSIVNKNYQNKKMFDTCQVNSFSPFMTSNELEPNYKNEKVVNKSINQYTGEIPNSGKIEFNAGQAGPRSEFYGGFE